MMRKVLLEIINSERFSEIILTLDCGEEIECSSGMFEGRRFLIEDRGSFVYINPDYIKKISVRY
jgi:hypothetical protein